MSERIPPACGTRNTRAASAAGDCQNRGSIVVQDRAGAAALGEQRLAAVAEQVEVEVLAGLRLAVALDLDRNCLRGLARGEGQRPGLGDVVAVLVVAMPSAVRNDIVTAWW